MKPEQIKNKTKADTLSYLKPLIRKSTIEEIFVFTVKEWYDNKSGIIDKITKKFTKTIVIRSSAIGEDSEESSQAGNYTSILGIKSESKKNISKAVENVIKSYLDKGNTNKNNQVLVQNQSKDIVSSGVAFTRANESGSPYYIINYDISNSTDSVTQGKIGNTIKISRFAKSSTIPKKWSELIVAIREIEKILNTTFLDIEFGINKSNKIIIFQARPLTTVKIRENFDSKIEKLINKNKKKFLKITKTKVQFKKNIFSDMTDWNPSEIIGTNPNPLDYSLYDYLIMQRSWSTGRKIIGYQNVQTNSLMIQFGNKPYVDINASFNSLIPEKINSEIKRKLMKFYINKLKINPELHDKVEFEIIFTCYNLLSKNRLQELKKYGFNKNEIDSIQKILLEFTNEIIQRFPSILQKSIRNMNKMKSRRTEIYNQLKKSKSEYCVILDAVSKLLNDCKKYGTLDFACMARIAFISTDILKSLVHLNHLKPKTYEKIMNSIETPVSDIQKDYELLVKNQLKKNEFLKKYGHLRPGTYDITQFRYDMNNPFFENIKFLKKGTKQSNIPNLEFLEKIFKKHSLDFENTDFYFFIKQAISQREYLKFEFTKNLSDALELIAKAGKILGFTRTDMSFLSIKLILNSYIKFERKEMISLWKKEIEKQKKIKQIADYLVLPPLITSENDFYYQKYNIAKPNFVTLKSLSTSIEYLENTSNIPDLEDKIVLLENADPGYDWIFTKNIGGLITKYGGSASHMAIRCAELGIPAAIGCGELIFENLTNSSKIMLDCKNQQIIVLEKEKFDELTEVKKTLKSLGYIK